MKNLPSTGRLPCSTRDMVSEILQSLRLPQDDSARYIDSFLAPNESLQALQAGPSQHRLGARLTSGRCTFLQYLV